MEWSFLRNLSSSKDKEISIPHKINNKCDTHEHTLFYRQVFDVHKRFDWRIFSYSFISMLTVDTVEKPENIADTPNKNTTAHADVAELNTMAAMDKPLSPLQAAILKGRNQTTTETTDLVSRPLQPAVLTPCPPSWTEVSSPIPLSHKVSPLKSSTSNQEDQDDDEDVEEVVVDSPSSSCQTEISQEAILTATDKLDTVLSYLVYKERPWFLKATDLYERARISNLVPQKINNGVLACLQMTDSVVERGREKIGAMVVGLKREIATGEKSSSIKKAVRPLVQNVVAKTAPVVQPLIKFAQPYLMPLLSASEKLLRSNKTAEAAFEWSQDVYLRVEDYCTTDDCSTINLVDVDNLGQD